MKKSLLSLAILPLFLFGCAPKEKYYVKTIEFPEGATLEQKVDMAAHLVPTPEQYAWQQLELTAFFHFGINTFTGREWGDGTEDPNLFNPTDFNAEQWVQSLQDGGFKMVILTAKHHDGFCLWPTKTTQHSVASSSWKNGKGDVVRELKDACDKYGMKFGVYLSPWDRNADCYGDSPRYNAFFVQQLTELLSNYGEVHEVWFDGANAEGPNGKKQIYDWKAFYATIDSLQPHAVKAIMGDDVRWVGNEKGLGRETEWSATALTSDIHQEAIDENKRLGIEATADDLGSRELIGNARKLFWYPSEVDVSIRPGWFYHDDQDSQVKSLAHLVDIYFKSVGMNSVLLLNIPPDRRGLINEHDVVRLKEFSAYINQTFAQNKLASDATPWQAKIGESKEYEVTKGETINTFMVQEDIQKGQRIEAFTLEAFMDGSWKELAKGTTIGYKRLLRFADCQPEKLRLTVNASRGLGNIQKAAAYYAPEIEDENAQLKLNEVSSADWKIISADSEIAGQEARLAIDGNQATSWKSGNANSHSLVVDMGQSYSLKGFTYAPLAGENKAGTVFKYNFYVSTDCINWTKCLSSGEFSNIMHNPIPQFVRFENEYPARYFKFESVSEINNQPFITVSELGILIR